MRIGAVTASKIAKKMQVAQGDGRFRIICGGIYLRFVPLLRLRLHAAR